MKKIIFGLMFLFMIGLVLGSGYELVYSEDFEGGTNGNPFSCEYTATGQGADQTWVYSDVSNNGVLSVSFSTYTDSLCGLPKTLNFLNKDYKITYYTKLSGVNSWAGIGMTDYTGTGGVYYNDYYYWWASMTEYSPSKLIVSQGDYDGTRNDYWSDGVPQLGDSWYYHEVYLNASCTSHYLYDATGVSLIDSHTVCEAAPASLDNMRLGLFTSLQSSQTAYFDDVNVYVYVSCTPEWQCSGYSDVCVMFKADCDEVTDINECGETYSGNYSEFPQGTCGTTSQSTGAAHQQVITPKTATSTESQGTAFSIVGGEKFNLWAWIDSIVFKIRGFFGGNE